MDHLPNKLLSLKGQPAVMSTEFLGAIDEDDTFSYAYKFSTNQETYFCFRWYALHQSSVEPPAEWLAKNDASKWLGSRDFKKVWEQKIKEELLRVRKNLTQDTFEYFLEEYKGDDKNGLEHLKTEGQNSEPEIQKAVQEFKKIKACEKTWKSIKL